MLPWSSPRQPPKNTEAIYSNHEKQALPFQGLDGVLLTPVGEKCALLIWFCGEKKQRQRDGGRVFFFFLAPISVNFLNFSLAHASLENARPGVVGSGPDCTGNCGRGRSERSRATVIQTRMKRKYSSCHSLFGCQSLCYTNASIFSLQFPFA
jgi:hypothetical protein